MSTIGVVAIVFSFVAAGAFGIEEAISSSGPGITLALIIIAGIQFGLLASIGFMVFHAIGSVLNSMREMRSMLAGNPPNPWPGRILSWTISFLLVGWLSGGFQ